MWVPSPGGAHSLGTNPPGGERLGPQDMLPAAPQEPGYVEEPVVCTPSFQKGEPCGRNCWRGRMREAEEAPPWPRGGSQL